MDKQSSIRRCRLVLFPCPLQGHINPMLQLATILHSHSNGAFSITIVHTHFNSPNPSNYPNFTFVPIPDGLSSSSQTQTSLQDIIPLFYHLNKNCITPFKDCLVNKILPQKLEPPVACIISDAVMYFTQSVADSLQLPRLVLRTGSAMNFLTFALFPLLCDKGYLPIKEYELESAIPELPPLKVKDLPTIKMNNFHDLYQFVVNTVSKTKHSSGLILNTFESLEQSPLASIQQELIVPNFPIGPFHIRTPASSSSLLKQDHSCISWLNNKAPSSVIYISFGSIAAVDETQLVEIAMGIANSEQSFLWVIRPGLIVHGSSKSDEDEITKFLPEEFNEMMRTDSERGCIVKWAPQQTVLAHPAIGGFWTHNGWNSTLESICEGVPMLCWPCFGDQMVNAKYVSEVWRVGLLLDNGVERGEIERSIRRLMSKENIKEREEMMLRIMDLKEKAHLCVGQGGSSFNSLESLSDHIFSLRWSKLP